MAENEKLAAAAAETPAKKEKAEKKADKKPEKNAKPGFFARVKKWFREMVAELKKVSWPTWKQTLNNTLIVLAFCIVVGICIFAFDKLAEGLLRALVALFHSGG